MTKQQAAWALSHDWALSIDQTKEGWIVWAWDSSTGTHVKFADFQTLRNWAGY